MKFLVFFDIDLQIVLLHEDDVMLGDYAEYTTDQWRALALKEVNVKAIYDDLVFDASVLMMIPDDDDPCIELLSKLRACVKNKNYRVPGLLRYCGTRVKTSRLKFQPIDVG